CTGARAGPAPGEVVRARRPRAARRRGHPGRPGPAGRLGPRSGPGRRRPRRPAPAAEAVKAAADFGGPLSVKIVSADILHKSDTGGVVLDVPADEKAVRAAYRAVIAAAPDGARIDGVLISPMRRSGTELLVGVVRDP